MSTGNVPMTVGQTAQDPFAETEQATPEEQQQYTDIVTRALMFISDSRNPAQGLPPERQKDGKASLKAPRDAVIDSMNVEGMTVPQAVGNTAAEVLWLISNNAKRQGVKYDGGVLFAAGEEVVSALYGLGRAADIWTGLPKEGSKEETDLVGRAFMEGVRTYGQKMKETGQLDQYQDEALHSMKEQIDREAKEGLLANWNAQEQLGAPMMSLLQRAAQGDPEVLAMIKQRGGQNGS